MLRPGRARSVRGRSGAKEIKLSGNKTVVRHCVYMRDTRDFNRQRGDVTYQQGVTTYKRRLGENVTTTTLTGFLITASLRITIPEQTRHLQLPTEFRRFVVERGGGAGTRLATHRALAPWEGSTQRHRRVLNLQWPMQTFRSWVLREDSGDPSQKKSEIIPDSPESSSSPL